MTTTRRLIINADDFGLSPGVNRGIVEAHASGSVTSTSMLVNLPAFGDAVHYAARSPGLGVGLHFNLTAGAPLSRAEDVPSLCDPATGRFLSLRRLVGRALTFLTGQRLPLTLCPVGEVGRVGATSRDRQLVVVLQTSRGELPNRLQHDEP